MRVRGDVRAGCLERRTQLLHPLEVGGHLPLFFAHAFDETTHLVGVRTQIHLLKLSPDIAVDVVMVRPALDDARGKRAGEARCGARGLERQGLLQ